MKVLTQPPTEENWSIKYFCNGFGHGDVGCGAKLKIYREDLRYRPPAEDQEQAVTFKCIACGQLTDIGWEYFPPNHKELKPYKRKWLSND